MKAIAIERFGGREQLALRDLPEPEPGPGEVRIRVHAAGVNPVDTKIRAGALKDVFPHEFPLVPGWDCAGVVERVGPEVESLCAGDPVFAYCRKPQVKDGTYAEFVTLPARHVALKPFNLSMEEAAAIPLAGLTALQCLNRLELEREDWLLVQAAAGGVGGFLVQLATTRGVHVIGTASADHHAYVRQLGAALVVDYSRRDFRDAVLQVRPQGLQGAFDCIGGDVLERSAECLGKGGRLVGIVDPVRIGALRERGVNASYVFVEPDADQLAELALLADVGKLRVELEQVLPLAEAAEAHALSESGHVHGKIVLKVA